MLGKGERKGKGDGVELGVVRDETKQAKKRDTDLWTTCTLPTVVSPGAG